MTAPTPCRYRLTITPDLEDFEFDGQVQIHWQAEQAVDTLRLHALDLAVWRCLLVDGETRQDCAFSLDPAAETLSVRLPRPASGSLTLQITYRGRITDRMVGFYRSRYSGAARSGFAAVTQFQESDARRAFPCLDRPDAKAVFDLTLVIPPELTAIANERPIEETVMADGRRRVVFGPTPRMSTYLVFFGLGPFHLTGDETDPRVRIATLPGHRERGRFGLTLGRQALAHCEAYFGISYPLTKLDLIAVPDFAFGAMENWGAITFRENLLLHDPRTTSRQAEVRIAEVVAHEIVHQWFGNLVTPVDWQYLWLNESFATYGAYRILADLRPDWEAWGQFVHGQSAPALERDALPGTPAIEIPGGEHVVINSATAPIIYSKGGSLLRQIEDYIGPESFRRGMRRYLNRHAYDCAASHHLWEAFEAASTRPVLDMVRQWVSQPGHPVITVQRQGDELVLAQRRFAFLPLESDQCWPIPLTVRAFDRAGGQERLELVFETPEARLRLPAQTSAFKLNDGHRGFYRVRYRDPEDLARLGPLVASGRLGPADRWGLQEDLFAMVRAGAEDLHVYLRWLDHYEAETALLPLLGIAANLRHALLVVGESCRQAVVRAAGRLAGASLQRLTLAPRSGEPLAAAILREQMIGLGLVCGDSDLARRMAPLVARVLSGAALHPDLIQGGLQAAARLAGPEALAPFWNRLEKTDSEHERVAVLSAMGAWGDWATARAALGDVLTRVPERNRYIPVVAAAHNPAVADRLWPWFLANRSALEAMHPLLYERVLVAVMAISGLASPAEVRRFAPDYARQRPVLASVIQMGLERLAVNERLSKP